MLVLSRLPDEKLVINTGIEVIEVTVARVRGDRVSLGVVAASHVRVLRGELVDRDLRERKRVAGNEHGAQGVGEGDQPGGGDCGSGSSQADAA